MTTRKWGGEFTVNTTTAGQQNQSAVTALADGGFMVAWTDDGPADSVIRLQRYDAQGSAVGSEILFPGDGPPGDQSAPDLVQLSDGNIWVTHTDFDTPTSDNAEGQVISVAGGNVIDRLLEFGGSGDGEQTAVASLGANGSVGVYVNNAVNGGDIFMDIYDGVGTRIANDRAVNTNDAGSLAAAQIDPDVAANAAGDRIAVVWRDNGLTNSDIRCRVFNQIGDQVAAEFTINTAAGNLANSQYQPSVTWLDNEKFVVAWTSVFGGQGDLSVTAIKYAIYSATGALLVPEQLANSTTRGTQSFSCITALPDGGFAISFMDEDPNPTSLGDIRLQVFDGNGEKRGSEILVNTDTANQQVSPALTALSDGRIVVTWHTTFGDISAQIIDPRDGLIYGTVNGDTLYGHAIVNDEINGLDGADTIFSLGGNDQVHAGSGADVVTLGRGDDVAYGGAGDDILDGNNGEDVLRGEGGEDTLNGGKGDDEMFGGGGNDILIGGLGEDAFDGGADTDTADYSASTKAVIAALNGGFTNAGDALGDTFTSIENITGTAFNDTLRGTNGANVMIGGVGNDQLQALGGLDTLTGGLGNDTFFINNPNDGADTITDFSAAGNNNDRFELRGSNFGGLAVGALLANQFQSSAFDTAQTANVRFFFDTFTGNLFWDRDGNAGAFGPVLLATLQPGTTVVLGDFTII